MVHAVPLCKNIPKFEMKNKKINKSKKLINKKINKKQFT